MLQRGFVVGGWWFVVECLQSGTPIISSVDKMQSQQAPNDKSEDLRTQVTLAFPQRKSSHQKPTIDHKPQTTNYYRFTTKVLRCVPTPVIVRLFQCLGRVDLI